MLPSAAVPLTPQRIVTPGTGRVNERPGNGNGNRPVDSAARRTTAPGGNRVVGATPAVAGLATLCA
ncbi:hypothetical protein, partial [Actinosynnema sp. NPDC023587]|uniref:hypothetical protein n=1 Tax=Actinosynnema sp. NPDC023587 TaxID=3154695 RepID=UPI0033D75E9A